MGYYTYYTMEVRNVESITRLDELCKAMYLGKDTNNPIIGYAFDEPSYDSAHKRAYFGSYGECKWYDSHEDMTRISAEFPEMVFQLHGEGEECPDLWDEYYENGESEYCEAEVVYPRPQKILWDINQIRKEREERQKYMPELYDREDVEELCKQVHKDCLDWDCTCCTRRTELDENTCKTDLILELWRRLKNAEQKLKEEK